MDGLLIAVTVFSLVLAAVMSAVAWALLRKERKRSAARAEALESLAFASPSRDRRLQAADVPALNARSVVDISGDAEAEETDFDLPMRDVSRKGMAGSLLLGAETPEARPVATSPVMFERPAAPSNTARRWLALAAIALVVAAGFTMASALQSPELTAAVAASRPAAGEASAAKALALQSLRHAADAQGLFTVTGLVENPREGVERDEVEAVVYLFDDEGKFFASGRAPIEVSRLLPGDQSPFVVTIAAPTHVARYRVGFRQQDGRPLMHVDRRGEVPSGTSGDALTAGASSARRVEEATVLGEGR